MTPRNRIIGTGTADPASLLAHPDNWRDHPEAQAKALTATLDEIGWLRPVIVNTTTGHLLDGHLRVQEAMKTGQQVPVLYVELTETEEALVLATLDAISGEAETNPHQLKALLKSLPDDLSGGLGPLLDRLRREAGAPAQKVREELSKGPREVSCPRCGASW